MKYTENLNLKKPEYNDPADIEDINENMDAIDDVVHSHLADNTAHNLEQHIGQGGTEHAEATTGLAGFMSPLDKDKLSKINPDNIIGFVSPSDDILVSDPEEVHIGSATSLPSLWIWNFFVPHPGNYRISFQIKGSYPRLSYIRYVLVPEGEGIELVGQTDYNTHLEPDVWSTFSYDVFAPSGLIEIYIRTRMSGANFLVRNVSIKGKLGAVPSFSQL